MRTVSDVLTQVDRWADERAARQSEELTEVEQQIGQIETAMANLQRQFETLSGMRSDLKEQGRTLHSTKLKRAHDALFHHLGEAAQQFSTRELAVQLLTEERLAQLEGQLRASAMAPLVEEYEQFMRTVQPNLGSLPESYRRAVVQHHARLRTRLADHLQAMAAAPVALLEEPLSLELVYAVDRPDNTDELLVVVVPVTDQVTSNDPSRKDGPQTWLAARTAQAIYEAGKQVGFPGVNATYGGHRGLLVIEVELFDAPKGDNGFVAAFEKRLVTVLAGSAELAASRVTVSPRRVDVDIVFPPEVDSPPRESDNTQLTPRLPAPAAEVPHG